MSNWKVVKPRKSINEILNPSLEEATTGWTTDGTNTIARSSDQALFGHYGLKATYQNDLDLANNSVALSTSTSYVISAYVYLPSDWDGGGIRFEENVGGAGGSVVQNTNVVTETGKWQRIYYIVTTGSTGTDMFTIEAASAPTAGKFIYIDGAQAEPADSLSTYIDGDQPGCSWYGQDHASISLLTYTRDGGEILDFLDDLGLYVGKLIGTGTPPSKLQSIRRVLLPGAEFQKQSFLERDFGLPCTIVGSSFTNYHAQRQVLEDVFNPEGIGQADPIILIYEGSDEPKEIRCVYESGLEANGPTGFSEEFILQFKAIDWPFFQQIGQTVSVLDTSDSFTADSLFARFLHNVTEEDGLWSNLGITSLSGFYYCISPIYKGRVYIGGNFTNFNGNTGWNYIVAYDLSDNTWYQVSGIGSNVRTLEVGPDNLLYAAGEFTNAGSVADADYIATFDGSSWAAVGVPLTGTASITVIWDIVFDRAGNLYVGGDFTDFANVAAADYIAVWDGSSWAAVGTSGITSDVLAMAVDSSNTLWVAGSLSDFVIKTWDGTTWTQIATVDSGAGDGYINEIVINEYDRVYFGGSFDTIGGVSADNVAYYNGVTFIPMDTGSPSNTAEGITIDNDGTIWICGNWYLDRHAISGIGLWNGSAWLPTDITLPALAGNPPVAIRNVSGSIFVVGTTTGTTYAAAKTTVNNASNMRVFPKFTVSRSGGSGARLARLYNFTTGKGLWLDYELIDGETITIDFTPGNRSAVSSILGPIWGILLPSDFAEFFLVPGDNEIITLVSPDTSPTVTAFLSWRKSFLGAD